MEATLDHLVLGANTLEEGIRYIESTLGVTVPRGGEHPHFGTHNCVMRLNNHCYFEIIAVDPSLTPVQTPRWYGLDDHRIKSRLTESPALIAWVVGVPDLSVAAKVANWIQGDITELSRGSMRWQMLVPSAGLADDPLLPWLIHWPEGQHPWPHLQSLGCSLAQLRALVPEPERFSASLNAVGAGAFVDVVGSAGNAPRLQVSIDSPRGLVDLPWA